MKKQSLIHLHGLFAEVKRDFEETSATPINAPLYNVLNITEQSIDRSKADHKEAVLSLADALSTHARKHEL